MTGNIAGDQNPRVGTACSYEIKPSGLSLVLNGDYKWYLFKKQKNGSWKDITGKPKTGEKLTYKFGEIALGIEFQMKVYEIKKGLLPGFPSTRELAGSLIIIPISNKVPKIDKVVLFNRGVKDFNKASYHDTLIAQAHCIAMFNKEIEFHLWEDDAPGKGHDANINKNNRHTRSYKARVNEKGIAEVSIPLMSDEKILRQMANQFLMKGDRNEGANHEYYVTATYSGQILGASQVNVDVANPDYKGQPQNQPQPKPQPEKHTPKFPAGQGGGPKQPDTKGNIIEAVFIDNKGNELSKVAVGDKVRVRIHSKNMVGKHIQYVIWESDSVFHDEVYRSRMIKIPADICDTSGFVITKAIFEKGTGSPIGGPDSYTQNYFIEIISKDLSAESQKCGVNSDSLLEVETVRSAVVVQKQPEQGKSTGKKVCECEARVKAYMRMLRVGEGTGEIIKSQKYNKEKKKIEVVYITNDFEGGYTKLFGGSHFTDPPYNKGMTTHPNIKILWYTKKNGEKVCSSATGAYQVMGYTWYDNEMIKKRTIYKIKDFSPENQDKFCLVLFKHKREGMLDLIMKGDIQGATEKYGSYEWASLPPGRYGQPIETMEKALELYTRFYQEELSGKSPLHLKKGFLKEFGYDCCGETSQKNNQIKLSCGKSEIDLRDKIKWQTQFDSKWGGRDKQMVACKKTCDDILINSGLRATSLSHLYQTAIENNTHTNLDINTQISKEAVLYLDTELEKGYPVQVGVDHGLGYKINNNADHSTDHFVVIVGRKCDGIKCYYIFYDVGTSNKDKGASDDNRLYLDPTNYSLKGNTVYNGNLYTVTQIRKN